MHTVWVIKLFLLIVEVNCKVSYNYSSEFTSPVYERQNRAFAKTQTVFVTSIDGRSEYIPPKGITKLELEI